MPVKEIDFLERRNAAADAKKKLIEKMRLALKADDPVVAARRAEKASGKATHAAARRSERDRLKQEAEVRQSAEDDARALAENLAAKTELEAAAQRSVVEKAEQKAERDRRYAARKNRSR